MAETIETEELEGLCREICREMVPNWDIGAGPRPGPGATTRNTQKVKKGKEERKDRQAGPKREERGVRQRRRKGEEGGEKKHPKHESSRL